jgi:hypothetical protein
MAIEIDFGRDLGAVAFPDDVSEEQAQQYVRDNYQAIRKSLIEQRQEELAAETEREEKAKFQLGQYGTIETALNTLSELPRGALEGIGQTLKGVARLPSAIPGPTYDPYTEVPLEQDPLYRAGQAVQEFGQETYPGLPGVRETVPAQIMAGIGSTVSTLPAAVIAGPVGAAVSYGLQSGESAAEEADTTINRRIAEALANRQYDLAADLQDSREQKKNLAFITTAPIGAATEGLLGAAPKIVKRFATGRIGGIGERLAERLVPQSARYQRRFLGVTGAERVRGAVEALATEGVQESAEQLGGNIAAAAVYDPERGWLDGVAQAGFIGAASGGIVGGLVGSRPNAKLANAAAESLGGDPTNPLPRANATVAGIEDTQQEGEAEITAEDVLKMSQETGVAGQEEVVTPTPTPKVKPAPAASEVDVVRLDQLRLKADAGTINPEELAELTVMHQKMGIPDPVVGKAPAPEPPPTPAAPVDTETGLTADEQDELDQLITAEDAGLLSEEGAITLAAYRSRLGFPAQPQAPTPSAVQEQGPDEGVLRREEPQPAVEVELRQVDQGGRPSEVGGAEAEVTPEEVQQVKAEVVPEPAPVPATTPEPAPEPATPAAQSAKLPKDLAGAKPRYNVSMDAYLPTFGSDFDRAAFIVTQKTPSKRDADYLNWAVGVSGLTPEGVRKHGLQVRAQLKQLAAQTKGGTSQKPAALTVPVVAIEAAPAPAPTPAPIPAPAPTPAPEPTPTSQEANPTAKVREAEPGEQAQPPAAAATPMQEGINNLKFVSEPVAKVRGGGMDPKDAKAKLVQQLERAVEAAPDASDPDSQVPKVTIEIPGDGTYTVANTKQALNQVLDKARKLNTSMAKGPVKAPAARQKAERPKEALMRMAKQAVQVYGNNAAAKLREQANNADLDLTDEQRNELKVVADMLPEAPKTTAQSAIEAIDKVSKGLSENQYSDPLFLTPLAKLALQIAKGLIQVGVAVDQAIRQAIAQARQQFPNDPADDIQLADRLIRDAQYTEAVAAGDMETAQRMVDEAAKAAGYDTRPYYHGTDAVWTEYEDVGATTAGGRMLRRDVPGAAPIFVSSDPDVAESYGENVKKLFIDFGAPGKQATIDAKGKTWRSVYDQVANALNEGAQSVLVKNVVDSTFQADVIPSDVVSVIYPEQIKSADPVTRDDAGNVVPLSRRFQSSTADIRGAKPDTVEAALQKVIAATDPRGKAFEAVAALSNFVVFQASKIALRIYQSTKSWVAARNAGMDYIKSHVQLQNEPETAANFEEHIKAFPNQEIPAGTPERPQPPSPAERVESRGIFRGDVTRDTDENWQAEARKWVDFFNGNLELAYQRFLGARIDNALREYVGGELLQRSELEVARAKNPIDLLRALDLQTRIAGSLVQAGSDFGKQGRARQLTFARYAWMVPQLVYRRLINEQQKRKIPFPEITATQVRDWLVESGQQAIDQVKEAMKQADNVFAREFRKIKQVPGEAKGPPIEIKWSEILTKSLQTQGSVRQKMLQVILADPQLRNLSPAGIAEITNLLTTAWENKRNQIFRAEFKKKIPLPNVKPDAREKLFRSLPRILKYANIARATPGEQITTEGPDTFLLWEQAFRDAVAPEFGVAEINGLTARKLTELAQKAQAAQGTNRNEIIQQMFRLMTREGGVRFSDVLRDYWYAAVLSGTRTQLDNALNILNGALNTAMLAGLSGKEAGLVAKSALKGLDEGIRDFWPMLWRGELYRSVNFNPDQPGNSLEGLGESRNLFAKGLSQAKYVSRLMLALDHVTAMMSDGAAKAYALQKEFTPEVARNLMLPDKASVQEARDRAIAEGTRPDLVNKRTREILQESFPVEILMTSKDIREAVTFTEVPQGVMGSLYEGLNAASRKFPALKFLTGTNFVRFAANYTNELLNYAAPIAAFRWYQSAPGRSDQPGGLQYSPARRDLLLAKATIGTALGATAAALFLGDDDNEEDRDIDITGSFKSLDPNKRKQLLAEGRQPYSIRVGDTYISYRQLGFGGLLGAIGELRDRQLFEPEKWNQEGIIAKVQDAATAGLFIVKDSSAISGLTEFVGFANAYKYDTNEIIEKSAPRYLARLGGSFVPNILKEVDAWSDPSIFKAEPGGLGHEYFLQQVPFARRDIGPGPILNVLGEPVRVERYPYSRWVTQRQDDPAWNTLGQLASRGVFMPTPAITVKVNDNGVRREMTREEKYQYQQAVGQGYRKFIEQNSKRLLALPPAEAADFIDKNADRIRRNARTNLKNSF